ncbi:MAG: hypothetical protein V1859_08090 [archaeon]
MKKLLIVILGFFLILNIVNAASVQPMDCEPFDNSDSNYEEGENICFYGTGFAPDSEVDIALENTDDSKESYGISALQTSKTGVLSSLFKGLNNMFTGVTGGIYKLIVSHSDKKTEYAKDIVVEGVNDDDGSDGEDNGEPGEPAIPEFSTIAAGLALIGAGFYANKKRQVRA